jgi:hypothetical protein
MKPSASPSSCFQIHQVVERARHVADRVRTELDSDPDLLNAAERVIQAAERAGQVTTAMRRTWTLHRLPSYFLAAFLLSFLTFLYFQFLHVPNLSLALPDRDTILIQDNLKEDPRIRVRPVPVPGSREAIQLLQAGTVDVAFVQGGIDIPRRFPRLELPSPELVLCFVRPSLRHPGNARVVLTSLRGAGSHSVAQSFFKAWNVPEPTWIHDWSQLSSDPSWSIPAEVDAVFVVKDPADEATLQRVAALAQQGFILASPFIGARVGRFDYLKPVEIGVGHLQSDPPLPTLPVITYAVSAFLVAQPDLTPRLLAEAARIIHSAPGSISDHAFRPDSGAASDLFQGTEAFLSILVHIGLAFFALLGLDEFIYRRRFHELNSLVSLLSLVQSSRDIVGVPNPAVRTRNLIYLGMCSDLLGLVSTISGYYTQENSSLLFNSLPEIVHQRCDSLKINIQLKLLHALIPDHPA